MKEDFNQSLIGILKNIMIDRGSHQIKTPMKSENCPYCFYRLPFSVSPNSKKKSIIQINFIKYFLFKYFFKFFILALSIAFKEGYTDQLTKSSFGFDF